MLLGAWPWWVFVIFVLAAGAGLAWLIRSKLPEASAQVKNWRAGVIWLLQFALAALRAALAVAAGASWWPSSSRSRISSRCWWTIRAACPSRTDGATREAQAVKALEGGVLDRAAKEISDAHLPARPANLARREARRSENVAACARDAHRRRPEATGRRSGRSAHRRGGAAQRRRRQFRRDRSRYDFHVSQPAEFRCTPSASASSRWRTTWRSTTPWSRRARWPIRGWPPK